MPLSAPGTRGFTSIRPGSTPPSRPIRGLAAQPAAGSPVRRLRPPIDRVSLLVATVGGVGGWVIGLITIYGIAELLTGG
jgi:hypothetical protein